MGFEDSPVFLDFAGCDARDQLECTVERNDLEIARIGQGLRSGRPFQR
jgi:hypothetical protein